MFLPAVIFPLQPEPLCYSLPVFLASSLCLSLSPLVGLQGLLSLSSNLSPQRSGLKS